MTFDENVKMQEFTARPKILELLEMFQFELKYTTSPAVFFAKRQSTVQELNSAESYTVLAMIPLDSF